jgi:DNA repair exonuclease SbcCD ATPase subunit
MFRVFFILSLLFSLSIAKYEKVKIGIIDRYYEDRINKNELYYIIKDIENEFESKLGFNIFDYSEDGKPIDILYIEKSVKKRRYEQSLKRLENYKQQIEHLKPLLSNKDDIFKTELDDLNQETNCINNRVSQLNDYIKSINAKKNLSKDEYEKARDYIDTEQNSINMDKKDIRAKQKQYNNSIKKYRQDISKYNRLINNYNRLQRKLEIMSKSIKEKKGVAKGYTQTIIKKFYKNGKLQTKKETNNYMEKIEIYGFENTTELKVVLAHEIAHLVGVGHINTKGALMNPLLQSSQLEYFELTDVDVREFLKVDW